MFQRYFEHQPERPVLAGQPERLVLAGQPERPVLAGQPESTVLARSRNVLNSKALYFSTAIETTKRQAFFTNVFYKKV